MNSFTHRQCKGDRNGHKGYGPTSFWIQNPDVVFDHLKLSPGIVFVDAGCGAGEYSLHAARILGEHGNVIALDTIPQSIDRLNELDPEIGAAPIAAHICDITAPLPLETQSADVIMLSTVLHIKSVRDRAAAMFTEFRRVLKPEGKLAVLECKKEEADFGPPLHSRLSADDVQVLAAPCGFTKSSELTMEHTYLACFKLC